MTSKEKLEDSPHRNAISQRESMGPFKFSVCSLHFPNYEKHAARRRHPGENLTRTWQNETILDGIPGKTITFSKNLKETPNPNTISDKEIMHPLQIAILSVCLSLFALTFH